MRETEAPRSTDFEPYLAGWRRRRLEEQRAAQEAARRARSVADRLAGILRERFGARRVVLFGSLAQGGFRTGSDVDLAAEGIPPSEFFRAGAEIERSAGGFQVDLVPIESAVPELLSRIEREGVELGA